VQTTRDLYKLLGLSKEATQDDIRKAHRRLVRRYHPDANPEDPRAEERFKEVQQAYEVLSNPKKRQEYDRKPHTSSKKSNSGNQRAGAGEKTGGGAASTVDFSDLLGKLSDLSSNRVDGREEGSFQLRGEDIARVTRLLGVDISRISGLLGGDITRFSKYLGENIKMNAKVSFGDARSGKFSAADEKAQDSKPSGTSNKTREKKVKGPAAQRKRKSD
jgi:DnaJ-class molecular chaperone